LLKEYLVELEVAWERILIWVRSGLEKNTWMG